MWIDGEGPMPKKLFGQPDGPQRGPGRRSTAEVPLPEDGAPDELQVLRHCNLNPAKYDKTQAQKNMRAFLKKDPRGFAIQLASLEREFRASKEKEVSVADGGSATEEVEEEFDEGSVKANGMIERLLKEIRV